MDRSFGHQVFIAIGAFVAGSVGVSISVFMLFLAWLVPSTRPAPPASVVDPTRRINGHRRKASRQESASSSESVPAAAPSTRTTTLSSTPSSRHVSFNEPLSPTQISHTRAATAPSSVARSRSSSPRPLCPVCRRVCSLDHSQPSSEAPPNPPLRNHTLTPIPSAGPSPLSSDETLTENGHAVLAPARVSLDSDSTDSEQPSKRKHRLSLLGQALRSRKPSHAPGSEAPEGRPLCRSATLGAADRRGPSEFGELPLEQQQQQAETARERGKFGWKLRRSRTISIAESQTQTQMQPPPSGQTQTKTKGRWRSRPSSLEPGALVDLAENSTMEERPSSAPHPTLSEPNPTSTTVPTVVITDMPRSASPQPIASSSTESPSRCRLSRPPPAQVPTQPTSSVTSHAPLSLSPRKRSLKRKTSKEKEKEKPARTQPYGPPYNVPPPDAGEWGVPCSVAATEGLCNGNGQATTG